jgi:hypothetical protein
MGARSPFKHVKGLGGSFECICMNCLLAVGICHSEEELVAKEAGHRCKVEPEPPSQPKFSRHNAADAAIELDVRTLQSKFSSHEGAPTQKQANSIAFLQVADETFDVGVDTRTGVNDNDYQVPFPFNGSINKLTFKLGPPQLTAADNKVAAAAMAAAKD